MQSPPWFGTKGGRTPEDTATNPTRADSEARQLGRMGQREQTPSYPPVSEREVLVRFPVTCWSG